MRDVETPVNSAHCHTRRSRIQSGEDQLHTGETNSASSPDPTERVPPGKYLPWKRQPLLRKTVKTRSGGLFFFGTTQKPARPTRTTIFQGAKIGQGIRESRKF